MRPEALNWSAENCTVGRAMEILGEKWTMVVLREIFVGIRRFEDMRVRTSIPRQVLTNRLAMLVEHGINIIEVLNLTELAEDKVYEFLFVLTPLKVVGATGIPVRPVAVTI